MKKIYWGFTKEQILILIILAGGIFSGMFLKYLPLWDKNSVYENFKKDSTLLAQKMEEYYSDSIYHSSEVVEKHIDSLIKFYQLENKKEKTLVKFPVNINTAKIDELKAVYGIGDKTAERIIAYRNNNGLFISINDLIKVKGIGPKKLEKMKPYIVIEH